MFDDASMTVMAFPRSWGPLTLVAPLAQGGMAELFWALDTRAEPHRVVVLKRVLSSLTGAPDYQAMLLREATLMESLYHPNLVRLIDTVRVDDEVGICLEPLIGRDLNALLRTRRNSGLQGTGEVTALTVAMGMVSGLGHLHARGILHRDVSPRNILIDRFGRVRLLDLGVSRRLSDPPEVTQLDCIKGKLCYMSPEQARGDQLDERSDFFAVGLVLFEMFTGRRFFSDRDERSIYRMLDAGDVPAPREVAPELDAAQLGLLTQFLAPDRHERIASTEEALSALLSFARPRGLTSSTEPLRLEMQELFGEALEVENAQLDAWKRTPKLDAPPESRRSLAAMVATVSPDKPRVSSRGAGALVALAAGFALVSFYRTSEMPAAEAASSSFASTGTIDVECAPADCVVTAASTLTGQPPRQGQHLQALPLGAPMHVSVSRSGYQPWTKTLTLEPDSPSLRLVISLQPEPAPLAPTALPPAQP